MDRERRQHSVEAVGFVGEALQVWDHFALDVDFFVERLVFVSVEECPRGLYAGEFLDAFG